MSLRSGTSINPPWEIEHLSGSEMQALDACIEEEEEICKLEREDPRYRTRFIKSYRLRMPGDKMTRTPVN